MASFTEGSSNISGSNKWHLTAEFPDFFHVVYASKDWGKEFILALLCRDPKCPAPWQSAKEEHDTPFPSWRSARVSVGCQWWGVDEQRHPKTFQILSLVFTVHHNILCFFKFVRDSLHHQYWLPTSASSLGYQWELPHELLQLASPHTSSRSGRFTKEVIHETNRKLLKLIQNRTSIFAKLQSFLPVLNGNIFAFHLFSVCHSWQNSSLESYMDHWTIRDPKIDTERSTPCKPYGETEGLHLIPDLFEPHPSAWDFAQLHGEPIHHTVWSNAEAEIPRAWHWKKFRSLYYQWWVFPQVTSTELCPPQICLCCKTHSSTKSVAYVARSGSVTVSAPRLNDPSEQRHVGCWTPRCWSGDDMNFQKSPVTFRENGCLYLSSSEGLMSSITSYKYV